ncbi:sensor domain-containing protein [Halalkalibacillus halophilus]|uniref:sensor domain-containing protein n=1 Tax=Halalkalibacillus halophilus TaxID=392827 RepID=UPI000417BF0F|nr:diguanylate cyclase [Halalkalibacillus halophilus]
MRHKFIKNKLNQSISSAFLVILALLFVGQFFGYIIDYYIFNETLLNGIWPVIFDLLFLLLIVAPIVYYLLENMKKSIIEREKAKNELKESEDQYRKIIELSPDAVIVQRDNIVIYTNDQGAQLLGGSQSSEILGKSIYEFIEKGYEHLLAFHQEGVVPEPVEQKLKTLDGRIIEVESIGVPITFNGEKSILTIDRDITKRKEIEAQLDITQRHYEMIANHMNDLVVIVNKQGQITYASPSHESLLGFTQEEVQSSNTSEFVHEDDEGQLHRLYDDILMTGISQQIEVRVKTKEGCYVWLGIKGSPVMSTENQTSSVIVPENILLISRDITERRHLELQLKHMAYFDELTQLPNRKSLELHMKKAIARMERKDKELAVFFIDLDGFKKINDQLGHKVGDLLLQIVAKRFGKSLREEDFVARHGGDEFIIVLEDITRQYAEEVARRITELLLEPAIIKEHEVSIAPSIGITMYPSESEDLHELIDQADQAMYFAKQKGRNTFTFYHKDLKELESEVVSTPIIKMVQNLRR